MGTETVKSRLVAPGPSPCRYMADVAMRNGSFFARKVFTELGGWFGKGGGRVLVLLINFLGYFHYGGVSVLNVKGKNIGVFA